MYDQEVQSYAFVVEASNVYRAVVVEVGIEDMQSWATVWHKGCSLDNDSQPYWKLAKSAFRIRSNITPILSSFHWLPMLVLSNDNYIELISVTAATLTGNVMYM